MLPPARTVTFELVGDTFAVLVNALDDQARLLRVQADEQGSFGDEAYAAQLRATAELADDLRRRVEDTQAL